MKKPNTKIEKRKCLTLLLRKSKPEDTSLNEILNLYKKKTLKKD